MKIILPEPVAFILETLENAGYEAYAVGGCVRDSLMGREPNDWDITTSAEPLQVKELFRRTVDTGLQHGTVTVMQGDEGFEVTTYRLDGDYEDGRHPKEVIFTPSLEEDLKRRDFTINAMAYNDNRGLVDLFGGAADIENKVIRCVGTPTDRFGEDALRILRAVRFSAQLGFAIEKETRDAIALMAENLKKISAERIREELMKLLVSPHPEAIRDCYELGLTAVFLPEFDRCMVTEQNTPHHCYTVGEHSIVAMLNVENDRILRLTMLLHDIGKPNKRTTDANGRDHFKMHAEESARIANTILLRLKFDNDTRNRVVRLIKYHDWHINLPEDATPVHVRRMLNLVGPEYFPELLAVGRADTMAQSMYRRDEKLAKEAHAEKLYRQITERGEALTLKDLAVNGQDLIAVGIEPGAGMGQLLQVLLQEVLGDPALNTKEYLLSQVTQYCSEQ